MLGNFYQYRPGGREREVGEGDDDEMMVSCNHSVGILSDMRNIIVHLNKPVSLIITSIKS